MTILIAEEIKGMDEKLVRDEVANPDDKLFQRTIAMPDIKKSVHGRARSFYTERGIAGATDLPFADDEDAVIDYYLDHADYQDATKRAAIAASNEAKRMIGEIEKEIGNLEALAKNASSEDAAKMQRQINAYKARILELKKQIL